MFKTINSKFPASLSFADALPFRRVLFKKSDVWLALMVSVLVPCAQECLAAEHQKPSEFANGAFLSREGRAENIESVGVGISQGGQGFSERLAELDGSRPISVKPMSVEQQKATDQGSKESSYRGWNAEDFQWFLAGII